MLERLMILTVAALAAYVVYRLFNGWRVRRVSERDPLLATLFVPGKPGIVLFTADFCQPCKQQQQPALERLRETSEVQVIQVDVEAHPEVAERWGVMSLPTTFVLDKHGQPRHVNHGVTSTEKLRTQLDIAS